MTLSMQIDAARAVDALTHYLADLVEREGSTGLLLGLSGGIDSAVLAALAVRAVGPKRVTAIYLRDRDSDPDIAESARLVAERLGLELEAVDMSEEMRSRGVYRPLIVKLLSVSDALTALVQRSYALVCRETPFKSSLRVGAGELLVPWYKRLLFAATIRHVDAGFSARHLYRRDYVERLAEERNLTLVGAANRSEMEVGWFVKDGIDDLPVQPMTGLLKTQVRQLAAELGLPERVITQPPSPDMAKGLGDEAAIGHLYRDVDIVVEALDRGFDRRGIEALGVGPRALDDIRDLMRLSRWKRESPHVAPPVDGRYGSALRGHCLPEATPSDVGESRSRAPEGRTVEATVP